MKEEEPLSHTGRRKGEQEEDSCWGQEHPDVSAEAKGNEGHAHADRLFAAPLLFPLTYSAW